MTTSFKPFVLHVDDEPDLLKPWKDEVTSQGDIEIEVCHPQDITEASLTKASLLLVDFKIEHWTERANAPALALRPPNGLAVLATLQEKAHELDPKKACAYALYTAVIQDVARELVHQPHIVARAHNLEWIFEKNGAENPIAERARRVAELAAAVESLPQDWPGEAAASATEALHKWLALPKEVPWVEAATREIRRCRPPIHEFAEHTHGIGVVRWVLHKILPYPTFLLDEAHVAARLRVSLKSLRAVADSAEFKALFGNASYQGQLSSFLGRRWWRAGVEHAIFEATADSPGDLVVLHNVLKEKVAGIEKQDAPRLFPVLGQQFKTKDDLATEDTVVEVRPDDWPPFADEAWALRVDLEDAPELKAVAVEDEP
ncbi:hypothetical protein [Myxococcus sp. AB025B]|uniref:hypothetical protein n=1 Tax=Myxococcus sp. AB025B TaxID=2562794 RepID=UPI001141DB8A|nr:hypothetical protein [Myxococcus sp. AB025B]